MKLSLRISFLLILAFSFCELDAGNLGSIGASISEEKVDSVDNELDCNAKWDFSKEFLISDMFWLPKMELNAFLNCAISLNKRNAAEMALAILKKRNFVSVKNWQAIIEYYAANNFKIEQLVAIEEARQCFPEEASFIFLETEYHISNKTVPFYRKTIQSKILGGDVRYYIVNAALNMHLAMEKDANDEKIRYYAYARQDLKRMQQINPNSILANKLLFVINDSLDNVLMRKIGVTKDRKTMDSLYALEVKYFLDYVELLAENTDNKALILPKDIVLKVNQWVRDTVYFEIANKSLVQSRIRYMSTPHCTLIGSDLLMPSSTQYYKLCVQPSASHNQFELTPTFFFTDYASSYSMSISGFVMEIDQKKSLEFPSDKNTDQSTFEIKILDAESRTIVYHAETNISKGKFSETLDPGLSKVKGNNGLYNVRIEAEGYTSKTETIMVERDKQLFTFYLNPMDKNTALEELVPFSEVKKDSFHASVKTRSEDPFVGVGAQHIIILLDVSQSMKRNGHFEKVKNDLKQLVGQLRPIDTISIITFASSNAVVVDHLSASLSDSLYRLIESIKVKGGTNAKVALKSGYAMARAYHSSATKNVLVLITDGKFTAPGTASSWYETYLMRTYRPMQLRLNMVLYSNEPSDFTFLEYHSKVTGGKIKPGVGYDLSEIFLKEFITP